MGVLEDWTPRGLATCIDHPHQWNQTAALKTIIAAAQALATPSPA